MMKSNRYPSDSFTEDIESTSYARRAHHAGSWYSSDADDLDDLLTKFLADAEDDDTLSSSATTADGVTNACISPHAGFSYSGPTAAYSYLALKEALLTNSALRTVVVVSARQKVLFACQNLFMDMSSLIHYCSVLSTLI